MTVIEKVLAILVTVSAIEFTWAKNHFEKREFISENTDIIFADYFTGDQRPYALCQYEDFHVHCNLNIEAKINSITHMHTCGTKLEPEVEYHDIIQKRFYLIYNKMLVTWCAVIKDVRSDRDINSKIYLRLIDTRSCQNDWPEDLILEINHKWTYEYPQEERFRIMIFDRSFDVIYFNSSDDTGLNTSSLFKTSYDLSSSKPFYEQRVPFYGHLLKNLQPPFITFKHPFDYSLPIPNEDSYFLVTSSDGGRRATVISTLSRRDLSIEKSKNLTMELNKYFFGMSSGFGKLAYWGREVYPETALRILMFDEELRVEYNVSLNVGFGARFVQLFLASPREMLVLVADNSKDKLQLQFRLFKIGENGRSSYGIVLKGLMEVIDYYKMYSFSTSKKATLYYVERDSNYCIDWDSSVAFDSRNLTVLTSCIDREAFIFSDHI